MKNQEYYLENHSTNYAAMLAILHDLQHLSKYSFTKDKAITTEIAEGKISIQIIEEN